MPDLDQLPPPVEVSLTETVRDYWLKRVAQHTLDRYAGVPLSKFPEDLRVYEHLLWQARPNVVIEIGTLHGGSALWFRDRLRTLASYGWIEKPLVISVDIDIRAARDEIAAVDPQFEQTIKVIEGDVLDPGLPEVVERLIAPGSSCFVIEDSAHTYETTIAALRGFAGFVPAGGFYVVEDGCVDVDDMRLERDWPRGVLPALNEWLATPDGQRFRVRRDLELYGVSCHPQGFLQRVG